MRQHLGQLLLVALLAAGSPATAGPDSTDMSPYERMEELTKNAPVSPNDRPMETHWRYAPEAPDGQLGDAPGPYLVSEWGNIVVRGRREGDRIVSALTTVQCGREGDPATQVTLLGQPPADLCQSVETIPAGRLKTIGKLFGASDGWTMMVFAQKIGEVWFGGWPVADPAAEKQVGTTENGAFFVDEGGKHVFYAPGETVEIVGGNSIVVRPVMTDEEIEAELIQQALRKMDGDSELDRILKQNPGAKPQDAPKEAPPGWFYLLFFGVPVALVAGLLYLVRRAWKRRRGALPTDQPQMTGALPTTIPEPLRPAEVPAAAQVEEPDPAPAPHEPVAAAAAATDPPVPPRPPASTDGAAWWRAQPPAKRRLIIGGTAAVLVAAALFVALRPAESGDTAVLRRLAAESPKDAAPDKIARPLVEQGLNGEPLPSPPLMTPAAGHIARFATQRPGGMTVLFDTFVSPSAADAALAAIRDHGPQQRLLLPADGRPVTSFKDAMVPLLMECRRTAEVLACMGRPDNMAMLLTVRVPADRTAQIEGISDDRTLLAAEVRLAIDWLRGVGIGVGIGNQPAS